MVPLFTLLLELVALSCLVHSAANTFNNEAVTLTYDDEFRTTMGVTSGGNPTTVSNVPDVETHLRTLMDRLIQESLPRMTFLGTSANVTGDCSAALFRLLLGVRKFEPWALRRK